MRVITFKIEETLAEQLDSYATRHNLSRSEVIRKLINDLVKAELEKETLPQAKIEKRFKL